MRTVVHVSRLALIALLLLLGTRILKDRYKGSFAPADEYTFAKGSAGDIVRSEVLGRLHAFQEGYVARDPTRVQSFVEDLFSKDNTLVLGTMPSEIFVGPEEVADLVRSDWDSWGDCRFSIDNSHISSHGDVAWFSTVGYVEFDLSRLLVLPLRLTGVLVKEQAVWRFRQLQFQFDLDFSLLLLINVLLAGWLAVGTVSLAVARVRKARRGIGLSFSGARGTGARHASEGGLWRQGGVAGGRATDSRMARG